MFLFVAPILFTVDAAANNLAFIMTEFSSKKEDLETAQVYAEMAAKLQPESTVVLDTLGWVHYKLGDLDKAMSIIEKAVDKTTDNNAINFHMGLLLHEKGRDMEARVMLEKAVAGDGAFSGKDQAEALLKTIQK